MNIGILIICTGRYIIFFESLFKSCEEFFLKNHKKTYYVFTDGEILNTNSIKRIEQPSLGWPYNSMNRFHMFNRINNQLIEEDYLFFLNANMLCINYIKEEIIPLEQHNYLMAVQHPGFAGQVPNNFSYERNSNSNFCIPYNNGKYYYQGNFNGGRSKEFLDMSRILSTLIDNDVSKGIIPIWHDESALNWYLNNRNPLMVSTQYASPEGWNIPNSKIINRNKDKWGGYNYLRN
jgi:hypothetical protein